jgi:flavin reductase (DIM6/NTAB) family NADH-FMN oxidoreductase RutF
MAVGPEEYRDAVRHFASGVTIITVGSGGELHGMTASSFASVSLEPPLILVSMDKSSHTNEMIQSTGVFAVNILERSQEEVARTFARSGDKTFDDLPHRVGPVGAPLLEGSLTWLECRTTQVVDGGDHDILIAEVLATGGAEGEPLVYYDRAYRRISES